MGNRAMPTVSYFAALYERSLWQRWQQQPPVPSGSFAPLLSSSSSSSCVTSSSVVVEGRIDGAQQPDPMHLQKVRMLQQLHSLQQQRIQQHQQQLHSALGEQPPVPSPPLQKISSTDQSTLDRLNRCMKLRREELIDRYSRGIDRCTRETITEGARSEEPAPSRDLDFLSRYLQSRSYDRSVLSQGPPNYPEAVAAVAAAVSAVDMDGPLSPISRNCESSSGSTPCLSSPSLNSHQEPSMITPLEADSVKRKRKKKMNKHKQRKLRRRDRHRN